MKCLKCGEDNGKRRVRGLCGKCYAMCTRRGELNDYKKKQGFVCGVGISDVGKTKTTYKREYKLWQNMLERCYNNTGAYPTYVGCTVCDRWLRFSAFLEDIKLIDNYELWVNNSNKRISLDKDMKVANNKTYCLEHCHFVQFGENSRESVIRNHSKPIVGTNILTGEIVTYNSATEAIKDGFSQSCISQCCNGKQKAHRGYTWKHEQKGQKDMKLHIIAAVGRNMELGKNNNLLWHNKADLQHFKDTTMGKPMIMGFNTLESLPCVLKGREHFVLIDEDTLYKDQDYIKEKYGDKQVCFYTSIPRLEIELNNKHYDEVMVIGGASIYKQFITKAHTMTITHFPYTCEDADVYFPKENEWVCRYLVDMKSLGDGINAVTYTRDKITTIE